MIPLLGWLMLGVGGLRGADITLEWIDNSVNEYGFLIERQEGEGAFVELARLYPNTERFVDRTAIPGRSYVYRVAAYNYVGVSEYVLSETIILPVPVNLPPSMSAIADQVLLVGGSTPLLPLVVGDVESGPDALVLSVASSDPILLPVSDISISGNGASRTVSIIPSTRSSGVAVVTLTLTDGETQVSDSFAVSLISPASTPTITYLSDRSVATGSVTGSIGFTVTDATSGPDALVVTATSTNNSLLPRGSLILGGAGQYRWLRASPAAGLGGTATITVTVSNGSKSASTRFKLTVLGGVATLDSEAPPLPSGGDDPTTQDHPAQTPRVYFSQLQSATGGWTAIYAAPDGSGFLYLAAPEVSAGPVVGQFQTQSEGRFSIGGGTLMSTEGRFLNTNVTGQTVGGFSFNGTHEWGRGSTASYVGIYKAPIVSTADGEITVVAGPAGRAWVGYSLGGMGTATVTDLKPDGTLGLSLTTGQVLTLRLNPARGIIDGQVQTAGVTLAVIGGKAGAAVSSRLVNLSVRSLLGAGGDTMIVGFSINGPGSKQALLRAVGPTLGEFGVAGTLADPSLTVRRTDLTVVGRNDNWGDAPLSQVSGVARWAFPLPAESKDSALYLDVTSGGYYAEVVDSSGVGGAGMVELYESENEASGLTRIANLSFRGRVGTGSNVVIGGFIIEGTLPKRLLIRAVGPELADFGLSDALADSHLSIIRDVGGKMKEIAVSDNLVGDGGVVGAIAKTAGAFPLRSNTKSAAVVVWLEPGAYTAIFKSVRGGVGTGLLEIYDVPEL
ncbi:MAG TPA: hypothetical protein PLN52_21615 [Opitutaceae bacterium]|nr:hypothetical protein [Opitutaceae bacterium]